LVNETGISYEDIKAFITYGEIMKDEDICKASKLGTDEMQIPKSVYDNLKLMDDKLADVRIADPAVGSGAFPMGMISEIVKARNNITAYIAAKYVINSNMSDSEKKMLKEQRARIYDMRNPYKLKRDTIKNSIYAVDIEASAVDIAKLRLWLSLVVEEELEPTFDEQVLGIIAQKDPQPLPNLDYNIMCGNSLIDEFEGVKLFDDSVFANRKQPTEVAGVAWQLSLFSDNVETLLQELFKLQDKYFNEDDTERKSEVKKSIDKTIDDIIRAKLLRDSNAAGLEKYDRSLKENTKPYFLWKLEFAKVFKEKGGFDIVIGNPPYLKELDNKNTFDEILRTDFGKKHSESKMNFWYFFFYKGLEVLSNRGNLCFISPNYYITGEGAVKLNQTIINDTTIKIFIDFNKIKVFENADIQCMILLTEKARPQNDAKNGCVFLIRKMFQRDNLLEVINNLTRSKDITYFSITNQRNFLSDDNKINFEFTRFEGILNKLSMKKSGIDIFKTTQGIVENPSTLTKKNIETLISKGIISKEDIGTKYFPKQEFFVISKGKLEGLKLNSEEKMFLRDYHEPSDIARFFYKNETDKKLIYLTKDNIQEIEQFPNLKRHLVHFKPFMDIRRETQKGSNLWFHLHWPRKEELFKREKIIFPQMCDIPKFAYCSQPYYINMSSNLIYKLDKQIDLLVFTGILNSNLAHFWLLHNAKNRGVGLDIGISIMDKFPINKEILTNNSFMRQLVLDIVNARGNNMDISKLELKLNDSVYQIYNINKNEIRIIENYIKERTNIGIRGA
jgi:adenine-specific DNA-methyltransferase